MTLELGRRTFFGGAAALAAAGLLEHVPGAALRTAQAQAARPVPNLGLHQVFTEDPSGVAIELNYPAAEAA